MVFAEDSFRSWWLFLKQRTQWAPEDLLPPSCLSCNISAAAAPAGASDLSPRPFTLFPGAEAPELCLGLHGERVPRLLLTCSSLCSEASRENGFASLGNLRWEV